MIKRIFCLTIVTTLTACFQSDKLDDTKKEHITRDITKMFDNYHNDIERDGLTAEFKYLDQSADFFWVPPGYNTALTYDSVRKILIMNAKSFQAIQFSWDTVQIFPLSTEIANYSGIVKGAMTDTSGIQSSVLIIESGTVIRRQDGWKLLSGQSAILDPEANE